MRKILCVGLKDSRIYTILKVLTIERDVKVEHVRFKPAQGGNYVADLVIVNHGAEAWPKELTLQLVQIYARPCGNRPAIPVLLACKYPSDSRLLATVLKAGGVGLVGRRASPSEILCAVHAALSKISK